MKIMFKEWCKDKTACAMAITWFILSIIYTILNARVVILISNTLSNPETWKYHLMILVAVCVIQTILSMIRGYIRPLAVHHCFGTLNNFYADKVLDSDVQMFTKYSCAHINTMGEYIGQITNSGMMFLVFLTNIVNIVTLLISIYLVGGALIIPVVIIYALGAIITKKLFHEYELLDKEATEIKKKRNQELENIVNGFMEVRSFSTQEYHRGIIRKFNETVYEGRKKRSRLNSVVNCSFEVIDTVGLVAVIIYSIRGIALELISQAQAMSLVMYVFRIIDPIATIIDFVDNLSQQTAMAADYEKVINYINRNTRDGHIEMDGFNDKIELKNISFAYDNTSTVLKDINMVFPKGKKIGICGVSGAGKSTLFKLLNRFYDQRSGDILVNGIEIHALTTSSYRRHVGSVHQENIIFPGTLKENILYGNFNVPEFEMIMACKKAKIYDFIMGLPDRFETKVGPRGLTLSGGQKQRIALARLFLRNPEIILLDEATSALDNESETFIQEAIDALEGKTIITIAHRISTIKNSDIIYVMGQSGILEQGTHEELLALNGEYAKLNK
ncbi:MAG: ABC transporter ATP-binding protein/permease [Roseburia sp.]|nr:ABC transporter ATP-binding protein/permease [Roseburia sp.]